MKQLNFYDVLARRRMCRAFAPEPITDDVLERVLSAALRAPTNDHLHQLEFVVIRSLDRIAEIISPVAANTERVQAAALKATGHAMDPDEHAMFVDALPKQHSMLIESGCLVLVYFRQVGVPLLETVELSSLNYLASAWAAIENILFAAAAEDIGCTFQIPIENESEHVKACVRAPKDYELACFRALGHPAEGEHFCRPKALDIRSKIHRDTFDEASSGSC